jgi:hypothetical protein
MLLENAREPTGELMTDVERVLAPPDVRAHNPLP